MKLLQQWWFEDILQGAYGEQWHRQHGPCSPKEQGCSCWGWRRVPIWWLVAAEITQRLHGWFWRRVLRCQHPAPHYHSDDWAGPESGGMGGHCDRCGFSFHHTMY